MKNIMGIYWFNRFQANAAILYPPPCKHVKAKSFILFSGNLKSKHWLGIGKLLFLIISIIVNAKL